LIVSVRKFIYIQYVLLIRRNFCWQTYWVIFIYCKKTGLQKLWVCRHRIKSYYHIY